MALQLNVASAKEYRDNLAKWHIADFNRADEKYGCTKLINQLQAVIKSCDETIAKWDDKSCTIKPIMTKKRAIELRESTQGDIDIAIAKRIEIQKQYTSVMKEVEANVPNSLVKAIVDVCNNPHDEKVFITLLGEYVAYFKANGYTDCLTRDIEGFARISYSAIKRASDIAIVKNHKHMTVEKEATIKRMILANICDYDKMAKVLPTKKWENVIEKRVKKNAKNVEK